MSSPIPPAPSSSDRAAVSLTATYLVIAAAGWYLLHELAPVLRPLMLAIFLAYVIVPVQALLARRVSAALAYVVLVLAVLGAGYLLVMMTYRSALELNAELDRYTERVQALLKQARHAAKPWLGNLADEAAGAEVYSAGLFRQAGTALANLTADILAEGLVVAVYLLFLLLEAARFPGRIRRGFAPARAAEVLAVVSDANLAIARYLKIKVLTSFLLAVPVVIILALFGVKFALLWGVLTFLLNFIPYVGSIIACTLPIVLAFLQLDPGWRPITVAVLLIADHTLSAYVVEPSLMGKAVGLSPLVIVLALAFWGLCWGLIGMLLAVPLTVVFKIVLEHLPATRPLAELMGEE